MPSDRIQDLAVLAIEAVRNRDRVVDFTTLSQGLLGLRDPRGRRAMSETELRYPFEFLLLNQLAAMIRARLPAEIPARPRDTAAEKDVGKRKADLKKPATTRGKRVSKPSKPK